MTHTATFCDSRGIACFASGIYCVFQSIKSNICAYVLYKVCGQYPDALSGYGWAGCWAKGYLIAMEMDTYEENTVFWSKRSG